jgi:hypothetical protein
MSKDCSSGTPAFIMVASWRVNSEMSLSVTLPAPPWRCLRTFCTTMPWRRSVALTTFSPCARISPRTVLPDRSLPSHAKVNSFGPFAAALAVAMSLSLPLPPVRAASLPQRSLLADHNAAPDCPSRHFLAVGRARRNSDSEASCPAPTLL